MEEGQRGGGVEGGGVLCSRTGSVSPSAWFEPQLCYLLSM